MKLIGIYAVENMLDHKKYIGQSHNLKKRLGDHKYRYKYRSGILPDAIRRDGVKNFKFYILEECSPEKLDELEQYYIKEYNSIYPNGYNKVPGGRHCAVSGEDSGRTILTEKEVYAIREDYKNHVNINEAYAKVAKQMTFNGFKSIWCGRSWKNVHVDVYTPENRKWHRVNFDRITNHSRTVSDNDVIKIRDIKNGTKLSRKEVIEMFPHININTFNDIWYNKTFKHLKSNIPNTRKRFIRKPVDQDGTKNPSARFTIKDVKEIRHRKTCGETAYRVYKDYEHICSMETFYRLWKGKTYKNEN